MFWHLGVIYHPFIDLSYPHIIEIDNYIRGHDVKYTIYIMDCFMKINVFNACLIKHKYYPSNLAGGNMFIET